MCWFSAFQKPSPISEPFMETSLSILPPSVGEIWAVNFTSTISSCAFSTWAVKPFISKNDVVLLAASIIGIPLAGNSWVNEFSFWVTVTEAEPNCTFVMGATLNRR